MFLTKKGDDMLYRHPHEIILQIFYSTKESWVSGFSWLVSFLLSV